jgi:hypothetical protein
MRVVPDVPTASRGDYRQRVVIRNPMKAMPKPIARFQVCSDAMGYCCPLT